MKATMVKVTVGILSFLVVLIIAIVLMLLPYGFGYFIGWIIEWFNGSVIIILETDLKVWLGVVFILAAVVKSR